MEPHLDPKHFVLCFLVGACIEEPFFLVYDCDASELYPHGCKSLPGRKRPGRGPQLGLTPMYGAH